VWRNGRAERAAGFSPLNAVGCFDWLLHAVGYAKSVTRCVGRHVRRNVNFKRGKGFDCVFTVSAKALGRISAVVRGCRRLGFISTFNLSAFDIVRTDSSANLKKMHAHANIRSDSSLSNASWSCCYPLVSMSSSVLNSLRYELQP